MLRRVAALLALSALSFGAQASLSTLPLDWPPVGSTGLEDVLFNVKSGGTATVALGAHAYKNSSFLPNDGERNFYASTGVYAPDGKNYANWSFDFAYQLEDNCRSCTVFLQVDIDPSAGTNFKEFDLSTTFGNAYMDSWNLEMDFWAALGVSFDPFASSITDFALLVRSNGDEVLSTDITVSAANGVPEPSTLALVGLALAGLGLARRRQG